MDHSQPIGFAQQEIGSHSDVLASSLGRAHVQHTLKKLIAERRKRASYFSGDLFADPAWDILLILALAESRFQRLSVSQLCERLDVPATTALRWLNTLTNAGLVIRREDVNDKRRKYVELSPEAYGNMADYCATSHPHLALAA